MGELALIGIHPPLRRCESRDDWVRCSFCDTAPQGQPYHDKYGQTTHHFVPRPRFSTSSLKSRI
jgi:hypothetical protein